MRAREHLTSGSRMKLKFKGKLKPQTNYDLVMLTSVKLFGYNNEYNRFSECRVFPCTQTTTITTSTVLEQGTLEDGLGLKLHSQLVPCFFSSFQHQNVTTDESSPLIARSKVHDREQSFTQTFSHGFTHVTRECPLFTALTKALKGQRGFG